MVYERTPIGGEMSGAHGGKVQDPAGHEGVRDVANLGEITADMLRATFPWWRFAPHPAGLVINPVD
jgi:hypothetical protein